VPEVLGVDARGREVLSHLPGTVLDAGTDAPSDEQLADLARWARELHEAVAGFEDPGPWRFFGVEGPTLVAHNDLAPYNVCWQGGRLTGVFDWDLAGPSTPLHELAHLAWNAVPLFRAISAREAARRLEIISAAYGGLDPHALLDAVPVRVQLAVDGIREAVARGDEQMRNLTLIGEPEWTEQALADLVPRLSSIAHELSEPRAARP
jgi:Ser/Thr protein kinase RdoA (MazF antagonist)